MLINGDDGSSFSMLKMIVVRSHVLAVWRVEQHDISLTISLA